MRQPYRLTPRKRDGIFEIWYYDFENNRRVESTGTRDQQEAQEHLERFIASLSAKKELAKKAAKANGKIDPRAIPTTLRELWHRFQQSKGTSASPKTVTNYRSAMRSLMEVLGEDFPLQEVGVDEVDTFKMVRRVKPRKLGGTRKHPMGPEELERKERQDAQRAPMSDRTLESYFNSCRWIFQFALDRHWIAENPFAVATPPYVAALPPAFFASAGEFQKFLDRVSIPKMIDLFVIGCRTGLRAGEIINLEWTSVNLATKSLSVVSNLTYRTKANKFRTIPMEPEVLEIFERLSKEEHGVYVFTDERGARWTIYNLDKEFKTAIRLAGLDDRLHVHSLRHTFASWLVQEGVSLYEVAELLGHASVEVTKQYAHLAPSTLHHAVAKLPSIKKYLEQRMRAPLQVPGYSSPAGRNSSGERDGRQPGEPSAT